MLTRKYFQAFSKIVRDIPDPETRRWATFSMARIFLADNPRFSLKKWCEACNEDVPQVVPNSNTKED